MCCELKAGGQKLGAETIGRFTFCSAKFLFSSLHSTHTLLSINSGGKKIVVASDSYDESHLTFVYMRESRAKSTKKKDYCYCTCHVLFSISTYFGK